MAEEKGFRHTTLGAHRLHDETLMLGYGYDPALSEGAVKQPVFLSSTFTFPSADAGRQFFDVATGRGPTRNDTDSGLIYARYNHPNAQIVEERLALLEGAASGAVFSSGMAAIATVLLAHCSPGDTVLHSQPLYGGTEAMLAKILPRFGIRTFPLTSATDPAAMRTDIEKAEAAGRLALIYLETPSNPLATLADIRLAVELAHECGRHQGHRPLVVVDNTLLGPLFQKAVGLGADLSVYSLTKFVGGHSDLVAGGVLGTRQAMEPVRLLRPLLGGSLDPHSAWMLARSLETVTLRMQRSADNALRVAHWLATHSAVKQVHFPALAAAGSVQRRVFEAQCTAAGALMSFDVGSRGRRSARSTACVSSSSRSASAAPNPSPAIRRPPSSRA